MRPKTIGLVAHTRKPNVPELVASVTKEFANLGVAVMSERATASLVGGNSDYSVYDLARESELLVVLGGDGTILHVVGQLDDCIKPIFGINVGSLGFLTCSSSLAFREGVQAVVAGNITFTERTLLQVAATPHGGNELELVGLNDAVISRGDISRLVRLQTRVDGETLTEFNADGLIVATPTGSTAYSLSAGGPILAPESGAFVLTPICPHVLTNRSIIVGDKSVIEIEVTERDYPVYLTVDGRDPLRLHEGSTVRIRKSQRTLPLAALPGSSFFSVVRQKLKWTGSNV